MNVKPILIVVDIGNTHSVMGVFEGSQLQHTWRVASIRERTEEELSMMLLSLMRFHHVDRDAVEGLIMASVVPELIYVWEQVAHDYLKVPSLVVRPGIKTGLKLKVDHPEEVGADRIVNAVAASIEGPNDKGVLVIDFGTAITFDVIGPDHTYRGGVIMAGLASAMDALVSKTAKLPRIELTRPKQVVGKTTVQSMESGFFWGYVHMINGLIRQVKDEVDFPITLWLTGGMSRLLADEIQGVDKVAPDLTLQGLRYVWLKNR